MARTAAKLLEIASAEVGYLEKATNAQLDHPTANAGRGNWTKYARDLNRAGYYNGNKNGYAWCDVFVDWLFWKLCGEDAVKAQEMICQSGPYGAGCVWSARYYRNAGRFYKSPKVGDQIFFGKSGAETHTGIVYHVSAVRVYTIEGNTSGASGVVPNGGGVCRKSYPLAYSQIVGYGRPLYEKGITVDGLWGKECTTRLQEIFGTTVDGIVSNQHSMYKASNPGLRSGWDWKAKPNGKGSDLIREMQGWAGMPEGKRDGEFGPNTCKAFQKKLGTIRDGKVSKPSNMVKALQRWCNTQ